MAYFVVVLWKAGISVGVKEGVEVVSICLLYGYKV